MKRRRPRNKSPEVQLARAYAKLRRTQRLQDILRGGPPSWWPASELPPRTEEEARRDPRPGDRWLSHGEHYTLVPYLGNFPL